MASSGLAGQSVISTEYINLFLAKEKDTYHIDDKLRSELYALRPDRIATLVPTDGLLRPTSLRRVEVLSDHVEISMASGSSIHNVSRPVSYLSEGSQMSFLTLDDTGVRVNYNSNDTDYILEQMSVSEYAQKTIHESDPADIGCATSDEGADTYVKLVDNYKTSETVDLKISVHIDCLLDTSPSPRDQRGSRMPSSA